MTHTHPLLKNLLTGLLLLVWAMNSGRSAEARQACVSSLPYYFQGARLRGWANSDSSLGTPVFVAGCSYAAAVANYKNIQPFGICYRSDEQPVFEDSDSWNDLVCVNASDEFLTTNVRAGPWRNESRGVLDSEAWAFTTANVIHPSDDRRYRTPTLGLAALGFYGYDGAWREPCCWGPRAPECTWACWLPTGSVIAIATANVHFTGAVVGWMYDVSVADPETGMFYEWGQPETAPIPSLANNIGTPNISYQSIVIDSGGSAAGPAHVAGWRTSRAGTSTDTLIELEPGLYGPLSGLGSAFTGNAARFRLMNFKDEHFDADADGRFTTLDLVVLATRVGQPSGATDQWDLNHDDVFDANEYGTIVGLLQSGFAAGVLGDTDGDLIMTRADLLALPAANATMGGSTYFIEADANLDGRFDDTDRHLLQAAFHSRTCTIDHNVDGLVNLDDLSDFANDFYGTDIPWLADYNQDDYINLDDLADFITDFYGSPC